MLLGKALLMKASIIIRPAGMAQQLMHWTFMWLANVLSMPEFSYSLQINVCVKVCYFNAAEIFFLGAKGTGGGRRE